MSEYTGVYDFVTVLAVAPSSQTVTISIEPPMGYNGRALYDGIIGLEAVVVAPLSSTLTYLVYSNPNANVAEGYEAGLTLFNVKPITSTGYFDVEIVDMDTGTTLAYWSVPTNILNGYNSITLSWDGYQPQNLWPYLVQAQPEEIVVEGLQCPPPK